MSGSQSFHYQIIAKDWAGYLVTVEYAVSTLSVQKPWPPWTRMCWWVLEPTFFAIKHKHYIRQEVMWVIREKNSNPFLQLCAMPSQSIGSIKAHYNKNNFILVTAWGYFLSTPGQRPLAPIAKLPKCPLLPVSSSFIKPYEWQAMQKQQKLPPPALPPPPNSIAPKGDTFSTFTIPVMIVFSIWLSFLLHKILLCLKYM